MKQSTLKMLELLKAAVEFYNRPVSYGDLIEFSRTSSVFPDFNFRKIRENIRHLLVAGEVIKAGNSGTKNGGRFVYLHISANIPEIEISKNNSPIQIVEDAFNILWNERVLTANTEGTLPTPIVTNDIYQYLVANNVNFDKTRTLANAMLNLSQKKNASIRKVERKGEHFSAWVPVGVSNSEVNLNAIYRSNYERIKIAVKRSVKKFNRAVCAKEILEEITDNPCLKVSSSKSFSIFLNSAARANSRTGLYINKTRSDVLRAGNFKNTSYFFYGKKSKKIQYKTYVDFLNLDLHWKKLDCKKHLEEIESCKLPTVAAGRALLVKTDAKKTLIELQKILKNGFLPTEIKYEAEIVQKEVINIITLANEWIESKNVKTLNLPPSVNTFTPGLKANELLDIIKPFYPKAQKLKDSKRLNVLFYDDIRRIRNLNFKNRFSENPKESALFLFDKTDALLFIALKWGGFECSFQANLAKAELGYLRDVRFIVPALTSKSFDERLSAIACLAFLQDDLGNECLRNVMSEDPDPNIRQTALWAYAFASGTNNEHLHKELQVFNHSKNYELGDQILEEDYITNLWRL